MSSEESTKSGPTGAVTADGEKLKAHDVKAPAVVEVGVGEQVPPEPEPAPAAEPAEPEPEEDFAELMAEVPGASTPPTAAENQGGFEPGDKVSGVVEVISLLGQEVFLDLGGKATGYILKEELLDEEGNLTVAQGGVVEGVVAGTDFNGVHIRRTLRRVGGDMKSLREAHAAGIPVEGKVVGTNKGGYEVLVAGAQAFCPYSQIDLYRPEDPESMVGRVFDFRVTEIKSGNSVVLSRAAILKEEQAERAAEARARIQVGARLSGRVRSIQKFGAFVDLGGVDGLVHVSELSWDRVEDPHHMVKVGDAVEVIVTEVDEKRDRIGLSMRQAGEDPFQTAVAGLQVGGTTEGRVERLTNFGAFVRIAKGVDGMIHVSDMAHFHVRHPKEVLKVGDTVRVKVMEIDLERRRIGLSLKALTDDPWDDAASRYPVDSTVTGKVESVQTFGVFITLEPGVTALLPASESGVPHGQPLGAVFEVGSEVEARVLRVDSGDRKMALTVLDPGERRSRPSGPRGPGDRPPRPRGRRPSGPVWSDPEQGSVGSFGEALLAALKKPEDK